MSPAITVGLDGSPQSTAAATWAAREAQIRGLALRLLYARDWHPVASAPLGGAVETQPWVEEAVEQTEKAVLERHPDLDFVTELTSNHPVPTLLNAGQDAELLVLGSRGLGRFAGFLLGSVAQAVTARAVCPVVLVRAPDTRESPPDTAREGEVVVGVSEEEPAAPVLEFAFRAAERYGARLHAVQGWIPGHRYYLYGEVLAPGVRNELSARMQSRLHHTLRPWREAFPGVRTVEDAELGSRSALLVAASRTADLVVVGRDDNHRSPGPHLGPVTYAALHHSPAPVAVVPHE
ncbi:universal stress protein [Streptomyces sp. NPDC058045]|uniref:universal stress protein n=1 Tax=Streptomyces sp. NPDC058045 TaxID=3346311 RepID=UPI0036E20AD8